MTLFSKKSVAIAALIGLALPAFSADVWAKGSAASEQSLSHPHTLVVTPQEDDMGSSLSEGRSYYTGRSTAFRYDLDEKGFPSGDPENPRLGD
jgi:hypothetical protein